MTTPGVNIEQFVSKASLCSLCIGVHGTYEVEMTSYEPN